MNIKKAFFWAVLILVVLVPVEIVSRLVLTRICQVSFYRPSGIIYKYYPELTQLRSMRHKPGMYDVLFLGASTLNSHVGNIEALLLARLQGVMGDNVRIWNLAKPAHSSRDDRIKYEFLKNKQFDLVLIYENINEVRANNCPASMFREDYSHYSWYEDVNILHAHPEIDIVTLPYVVHKAGAALWHMFARVPYLPTVMLGQSWVVYGEDIKTREPFKKNLEAIIDLARQKREKVLLMTFATYVPRGYSQERFERKELDYGYLKFSAPVEEWGMPANVLKGIKAHNQVIRALASAHKDVLFVDQETLIPSDGEHFADICHFTPKGCEKFVENVALEILKTKK